MKHNVLHTKGIKILGKTAQKNVKASLGLASESRVFACYCGFVNNKASAWFTFAAESINDALNNAGTRCNGAGATCQGMR